MVKILVVDDSKLARKRIINTIAESTIKYEILAEAEDGVIAFKLYPELKPNLIITDLEMPNMDGLGLIKAIREVDKEINILVVSSMANESVKQTLKSDRYCDFIKKPINKKMMEMLLLKVEYNINKDGDS